MNFQILKLLLLSQCTMFYFISVQASTVTFDKEHVLELVEGNLNREKNISKDLTSTNALLERLRMKRSSSLQDMHCKMEGPITRYGQAYKFFTEKSASFFVKPGNTFHMFSVHLKVKNLFTKGTPFIIPNGVNVMSVDLEEDKFTEITIESFRQKRNMARDFLGVRVYIDGIMKQTITNYWWRQYKIEEFALKLNGKATFGFDCYPIHRSLSTPLHHVSKGVEIQHDNNYSHYKNLIISAVVIILIAVIATPTIILLYIKYFKESHENSSSEDNKLKQKSLNVNYKSATGEVIYDDLKSDHLIALRKQLELERPPQINSRPPDILPNSAYNNQRNNVPLWKEKQNIGESEGRVSLNDDTFHLKLMESGCEASENPYINMKNLNPIASEGGYVYMGHYSRRETDHKNT